MYRWCSAGNQNVTLNFYHSTYRSQRLTPRRLNAKGGIKIIVKYIFITVGTDTGGCLKTTDFQELSCPLCLGRPFPKSLQIVWFNFLNLGSGCSNFPPLSPVWYLASTGCPCCWCGGLGSSRARVTFLIRCLRGPDNFLVIFLYRTWPPFLDKPTMKWWCSYFSPPEKPTKYQEPRQTSRPILQPTMVVMALRVDAKVSMVSMVSMVGIVSLLCSSNIATKSPSKSSILGKSLLYCNFQVLTGASLQAL